MKKQDKKRAVKIEAQDDSLSSAMAKGERLRRVRNLANLSREAFCDDGDINVATLISWEVGRFGGLSAKGAQRVLARIAKEGVFCTPEWLLYEIGVGPELRADYKKLHLDKDIPGTKTSVSAEKENIVEELMLFRKLNANAVDFIISDDAMLPHYGVGDYVAGRKRVGEKIKELISYDCIVHTSEGLIVMRNLQAGPRANSYNLVSTNLKTKAKTAVIHDVEIVSAAPVVWHRRQDA